MTPNIRPCPTEGCTGNQLANEWICYECCLRRAPIIAAHQVMARARLKSTAPA